MKKLLLILFVLAISIPLFSQETFHRVRINIENKNIDELAKVGVEIDHGHIALGRYIENDYSETEIKWINNAGFETEILIDDVSTYYREQLASGVERMMTDCENEPAFTSIATPENFTLGSMGGFYTYDELLAILDDMHDKFPDIITPKTQIGDILTYESREIYSVVISDNPSVDEGEPASLYNAIHHAREPNALTQLVFFMWYLLENYENDPLVKELLDNTALHFVPVVNPDGYVYNETIEPDGGGLWRKNRRDNGDGTFGVDLNRNYGFFWGFDDNGSSPNTNSQVYRGTEAFSEPETQALKLYCEENNFTMALNYHTHGNLLIHPWGYNDAPTAEDLLFKGIAKEMTSDNSYGYGTGSETVGYLVNGDADDWMYGEEQTKNKIYSMTPEAGGEGFWPPIDRIVYNCQANMHANVVNAFILLNYPVLEESSIEIVDEFTAEIALEFTQLGFQAAAFDVNVEVITDNATLSQTFLSYDLEQLEETSELIVLDIDESVEYGEEISVVIQSSNDVKIINDTLSYIYSIGGIETFVVQDIIGADDFWVADGEQWFYATDNVVSEEFSFTESPAANYENGTTKSVKSKPVILPDNGDVKLKFDLWVDIESNYDYAALYINTIGNPEIPLCGKYSELPQNFQPEGVPVYDGEFGWVTEEIDLTAWAGMEVEFTLEFGSDNFVNGEGIYIDNWAISNIQPVISTSEIEIGSFKLSPNPAKSEVQIGFPYASVKEVVVYSSLGQRVIRMGENTSRIDISGLGYGVYYVVVEDKDGAFYRGQVVVVR